MHADVFRSLDIVDQLVADVHGSSRSDARSREGRVEHRAVWLHGPNVRGGKTERKVAIKAESQEVGIAVRERAEGIAARER